jgi:hypothetical protein
LTLVRFPFPNEGIAQTPPPTRTHLAAAMSDSAAGLILVVLEFCRTGSSAADTHLLEVSVERVPRRRDRADARSGLHHAVHAPLQTDRL